MTTNMNAEFLVVASLAGTPVLNSAATHLNHIEKLEKFNGLNFKRW